MKKIYLLVAAIAPFALMAQPTLNNTMTPVVGDSYIVYQVDSNQVEGSQGANQTWDFSSWVGYGTQHSIDYVDPANTPYAAGYPNSTVAQKDSSSYMYMIPSSTDIQSEGFTIDMTAAQPLIGVVNVALTDYQQIMSYPFTFNSSITDTYSGNLNSSLGSGTYSGNIYVTGDAYGTLILPNNVTFNNVLRVFTLDQGTTSIPLVGTITYERRVFDFYDPNDGKHPIVSVVHTDLNGTVTSWVYSRYPIPLGVKEIENVEYIKLYPVPAKENTTLSFELKNAANVTIRLIDNLGKLIDEVENTRLNKGVHNYSFDISDLSSGVYFVQTIVDNKVLNKKLIIE